MLGKWLKGELARAQVKQADLARELSARLGRNIDRATVNKMVTEKRGISADELIIITGYLGVELPTGLRNNTYQLEIKSQQNVPQFSPKLSVPVLGKYGQSFDGTLSFAEEDCVEWTFSPPGLEHAQGIYAAYIHGTQMTPRYRPGEMVWINPNRPLKSGDDTLVKLIDKKTREIIGIVREFVTWRDTELVLQSYNPNKEEIYSRDEVVSIHPIVFSSRI